MPVLYLLFLLSIFHAKDASADSTDVSFRSEAITPAKTSSLPVGTVIAWYSTRNPDSDWIECNGQSFDHTAYPMLYLHLDRKKVVPDFRTRFLRAGERTQIGVQGEDAIAGHTISIPEQIVSAGRTTTSSSSALSDRLRIPASGSVRTQGGVSVTDAASAEDPASSTDVYSPTHAVPLSVTVPETPTETRLTASLTDGTVSGVIGAHTGVYAGASETVPKYAYVRYFIRAR